MFVDNPDGFNESTPLDWVNDWLGRRRAKSPASGAPQDANKPAPASRSLDDALAANVTEAEEQTPADPKALARAAAQRQRMKQERKTAIRDGLDELDR